MLKIRGMSNAENLLTGVNRFGHSLTNFTHRGRAIGERLNANTGYAAPTRLTPCLSVVCFLIFVPALELASERQMLLN